MSKDGRKLEPVDYEPRLLRLQHGMGFLDEHRRQHKSGKGGKMRNADDDLLGKAFQTAKVAPNGYMMTDVDKDSQLKSDHRIMFPVTTDTSGNEMKRRFEEQQIKEEKFSGVQEAMSISVTEVDEDKHSPRHYGGEGFGGGTRSSSSKSWPLLSSPSSSPLLSQMPFGKKKHKAGEDDNKNNNNNNNKEEEKGPMKPAYKWPLDKVKLVSASVLEAWNVTKSETLDDDLWFIYLLDHLLGLVSILSKDQLRTTLASVMSFNPDADSMPKDQYFHLDIAPHELYPDLYKKRMAGGEEEDSFEPILTEKEMHDALSQEQRPCSYFPSVWLYFVAFSHGHAIKVYNLHQGVEVVFKGMKDLPLTKNISGDYLQRWIEQVDFPFGSLGIVAGSVVHCGIGSEDYKSEPRFRMHSFCHVKGQEKGITGVHQTHIWQIDEQPVE